ncbi:TIGR03899 family protein [Motilimonas cestriensis]|uniref:TIGR03899 family protein n=1 Tax=Motilimonas cestriensis TaxID=2742685 RepID=A0ABS8WBW2_9GAMM|nr:TIGR03899 family protein [Motilimonas cestriensis]MCE2596512.1 TIGR03899 family protein [Motilimonas cestriensis]
MAEAKSSLDKLTEKSEKQLFNSKHKTMALARQYGIEGGLTNVADSTVLTRAKKRMALELSQKQHNLEQIMQATHTECGEDDAAREVDPDWMSAYLRLAETISSKNMQALWGKILAQEITSPASYSVRALETLKQMTNREAIIFQKLCQLSSTFAGDPARKIITGYVRLPTSFQLFTPLHSQKLSLGKFRFPYSNVMLMADLGLIYQSELESGEMSPGQPLNINYHDLPISLVPNGKRLKLYYYKFTQVGNELSKLISNDALVEYVEELTLILEREFQITSSIKSKA